MLHISDLYYCCLLFSMVSKVWTVFFQLFIRTKIKSWRTGQNCHAVRVSQLVCRSGIPRCSKTSEHFLRYSSPCLFGNALFFRVPKSSWSQVYMQYNRFAQLHQQATARSAHCPVLQSSSCFVAANELCQRALSLSDGGVAASTGSWGSRCDVRSSIPTRGWALDGRTWLALKLCKT